MVSSMEESILIFLLCAMAFATNGEGQRVCVGRWNLENDLGAVTLALVSSVFLFFLNIFLLDLILICIYKETNDSKI